VHPTTKLSRFTPRKEVFWFLLSAVHDQFLGNLEEEMFAGYWLVTDMDGTILSTPHKAGGRHPPLTESKECLEPLTKWIAGGGNLCVVSTAGKRMWKQVHEPLKSLIIQPGAGKLAICGFSGAAFFLNDQQGELIEDEEYRTSAIPGGTVIPAEAVDQIRSTSREIIVNFLDAALAEPGLITALSKKYHEPYKRLVEQLRELGKEEFLRQVLSMDRMLKHGEFLQETNDALVDLQTVPVAVENSLPPPVVQCTTHGIPAAFFERFVPAAVVEALGACNLYVKRQPNSIVIAKKGVDKSTCVRWLCHRSESLTFDLSRALAFGDVPKTIDFPLTQHPPMAFVSVSPSPEDDPPGILRVGREELGTSLMLQKLMETAATDPDGNLKDGTLFSYSRLSRLCQELSKQ
jgi:hydroxymethylpyrimidine pyrophosphatase-like HAD family hydrolase